MYAIGDIHGCLAPLKRLVGRLPKEEPLVFLGDYIDRGPQSAGVVAYLTQLALDRECFFLMGNHEDLMLKAPHSPLWAQNWLINGGDTTLASYGQAVQNWRAAADKMAFLGEDIHFFKNLRLYLETPDTLFVHAGIDLAEPEMRRQKPETLLWVREWFYGQAAAWQGKPVVFGHTPTHLMGVAGFNIFKAGRMTGIDTGCVYGGKLSGYNPANGHLVQEPL